MEREEFKPKFQKGIDMGTKTKYGFRIKHDIAWAWHIGIHFCVEPKSDYDGNREMYLFLCFGMHDFTIGFIHDWGTDLYD